MGTAIVVPTTVLCSDDLGDLPRQPQLDRDCVEVETPFGKGVVVESWRESHIKLPWGKLYAPALMR
jgi:hypothetical protein